MELKSRIQVIIKERDVHFLIRSRILSFNKNIFLLAGIHDISSNEREGDIVQDNDKEW